MIVGRREEETQGRKTKRLEVVKQRWSGPLTKGISEIGGEFGLETSKFYCKSKILHDRISPSSIITQIFTYLDIFTCRVFLDKKLLDARSKNHLSHIKQKGKF